MTISIPLPVHTSTNSLTLHERFMLHGRTQIRVQGCLVHEVGVLGIRRPVLYVFMSNMFRDEIKASYLLLALIAQALDKTANSEPSHLPERSVQLKRARPLLAVHISVDGHSVHGRHQSHYGVWVGIFKGLGIH